MPCFYIPSLYPFFTQSLPVTHTPLTLPVYVHTLHSLSILLIYPPLYYPTLQPPDSPYFKIRSLHSHSSLSLYTPLISYSLPSASTPFSTISTAQSPLGSPLVTRQTPLYNSHSIVLLYLLSAPAFYIPSQHPFFTPSLLPIYPPFGSPPFDTPSLRSYSILPLYTPNLSSSLPFHSTTPFYN